MRMKKRKTTEKETRHRRHHDSLHRSRVKCNKFWQKDSKSKQMTNWSVSTFKGKLKSFRFKIVKYKNRTFNRKFEIKPIPNLLNVNNHFWYCRPFFASDLMHNSTGYVIKLCTIELWSTWEVWRALKKLELPSPIASGNSYASFVLSKLSACSITL